MTTRQSPSKATKQLDLDLNPFNVDSPLDCDPHAPNSITGWDDHQEPVILSLCYSSKKSMLLNSPQLYKKPPIPPLKPLSRQDQTVNAVKANFRDWLSKRTKKEYDTIRKPPKHPQGSRDYFSGPVNPQEQPSMKRSLTSVILPFNQATKTEEGSPRQPYQPRGSVTSRRSKTLENDTSVRRGESSNNTPSPLMPIIARTHSSRQQMVRPADFRGSQTERGRHETQNVSASGYQSSLGIVRKKTPSGCFKSANSQGVNFSRITFMGLSRLMNAKDAMRGPKSEQTALTIPREQTTYETPEDSDEGERVSKLQAIRSLLRNRYDDIIIEEERPSAQNTPLNKKVRKRSEGLPVCFKNSMIRMPIFVTRDHGMAQVDDCERAATERLKLQGKGRKYRPKAFLKDFRPREKGRLPSNELNVQAFNSESSISFNV